jgi:hypothetical protein
MLHYQERMVVLLQDGPQLGRKAKALLTISSTMSSRSSVLEDAGADAGDKEDPELLKVGVAVQSVQHLLGGDEDAKRWGAGGRRAGVLFP